MAYLLGMVYGNGEIRRDSINTTISVDIPHKKLETPEFHDVKLYVKASVSDIKNLLDPLVDSNINFSQTDRSTILSFNKFNSDYLIREIIRLTDNKTDHSVMRIHPDVFSLPKTQRINILRGFADVTGYIRRSNVYFEKYQHRVYIEIPHNWYMVVDICNLLKTIDVPVQTIDWAHPNMRDPKLNKYNNGNFNFWKKEHQIKIWANEFRDIGFGIIHKNHALNSYIDEMIQGFEDSKNGISHTTHKYYWEKTPRIRTKLNHPGENDNDLPPILKGRHFDSWTQIAREMGYQP